MSRIPLYLLQDDGTIQEFYLNTETLVITHDNGKFFALAGEVRYRVPADVLEKIRHQPSEASCKIQDALPPDATLQDESQ